MDRIRIEGIEFHGFHGVPAEERAIGHRYRADVVLELDLRAAGTSDDVALTVDYAAVVRTVLEVGAGPSVQLVETLAERMAHRILDGFPTVVAAELRVAKLHPPVALQFDRAVIEIRRDRPASSNAS
jgi:dihydroneopterin aldolase